MIDGASMLRGAAAGVAGTIAMTALMRPGFGRFVSPRWRPDEFVPLQVVQWGEAVVGRPYALSERQEATAAGAAHLIYGASMGALFGLSRAATLRAPAIAAGAAWGLLVWLAGYEGWLPKAGVRPATTQEPPTKWPVPIGNHLVYGIVTALAYEALRPRPPRRRWWHVGPR